MKTNLEELVETANSLCTQLQNMCDSERVILRSDDLISQDDFTTKPGLGSLILELERYNWQALCMRNDIRALRSELFYE